VHYLKLKKEIEQIKSTTTRVPVPVAIPGGKTSATSMPKMRRSAQIYTNVRVCRQDEQEVLKPIQVPVDDDAVDDDMEEAVENELEMDAVSVPVVKEKKADEDDDADDDTEEAVVDESEMDAVSVPEMDTVGIPAAEAKTANADDDTEEDNESETNAVSIPAAEAKTDDADDDTEEDNESEINAVSIPAAEAKTDDADDDTEEDNESKMDVDAELIGGGDEAEVTYIADTDIDDCLDMLDSIFDEEQSIDDLGASAIYRPGQTPIIHQESLFDSNCSLEMLNVLPNKRKGKTVTRGVDIKASSDEEFKASVASVNRRMLDAPAACSADNRKVEEKAPPMAEPAAPCCRHFFENLQKKDILIEDLQKKVATLSKENSELHNSIVNHFLCQHSAKH